MLEILAGCEAAEVALCTTCDKGRVLRAVRDVSPGTMMLSSPLELQVVMPSLPHPQEAQGASHSQLQHDFACVKRLCVENGGGHGFDVYWSALLSLTAEEGPVAAAWPHICAETQSRILELLFTPASISSAWPGQALMVESDDPPPDFVDDVLAGRAEYPHRAAETAPTMDMVVAALRKQFALRVSQDKLERLALVWKYNAFNATLPSRSGAEDDAALELYVAAAMASHSCLPNSYWTNSAHGSFDVFAGGDGLEVHEEVCISYLPQDLLDHGDTIARRRHLARSWLFYCECLGCARVERPGCIRCSGKGHMKVVMCGIEEPLYPGFETNCDGCGLRDLHTELSYFYDCPGCHLDLCPCCALKCRAASNYLDAAHGSDAHGNKWDGCWTHRGEPGRRVEAILGDTIGWSTGATSRVYPEDVDKLATKVEDTVYNAELVGDELVWSDGDVWVRALTPFPLEEPVVHLDPGGTVMPSV